MRTRTRLIGLLATLILLGIVSWFYLTDRPAEAAWLTSEQKAWLSLRLQAEVAAKQAASGCRR